MEKAKKKAFTFMDVLVIIAIAAVLAVVGIVTYVALTQKVGNAETTDETAVVGSVVSQEEACGSDGFNI